MIDIKCSYAELVDLVALVENPRNPNKHPEKQIEMLAKIIQHTGFRHPVIVSKRSGFVVAGHGRILAAQKLGIEKVPVDYQDFASEAEEFQFLVADNKIAELAEHDDEAMKISIKELGLEEIDCDLFGLEDLNLSLIEEINHGDENSEWAQEMPDFEKGDNYIKITLIFESLESRENWILKNNFTIDTKRTKNAWISYPK